MTSEILISLGPRIVGVVFLAAALMKTAAPAAFYRHVVQLGLVPYQVARITSPVMIGLEAGWGVALVVLLSPRVMLPVTAVALVLLTGLTWWSVKSGKTEDCGCYGGFITPSIWQSVGMNALYLLLVVEGWATVPPSATDPVWKIAAVVVAIVVVGGIAEYALRSEFSTGIPLFTPSPLKIGRRWKPKWAGTAKSGAGVAQLVSYLGPDCPYCKRWVRVLNVIHASPELPPVIAVFGSSPKAIDAFVKENGVLFPTETISAGMMRRLASGVPTTVLVEEGMIQDLWGGQMSPEFVERFKLAFFPAPVGVRTPGATTGSTRSQVLHT